MLLHTEIHYIIGPYMYMHTSHYNVVINIGSRDYRGCYNTAPWVVWRGNNIYLSILSLDEDNLLWYDEFRPCHSHCCTFIVHFELTEVTPHTQTRYGCQLWESWRKSYKNTCIDGSVQGCSISFVFTLKVPQPCMKSLVWYHETWLYHSFCFTGLNCITFTVYFHLTKNTLWFILTGELWGAVSVKEKIDLIMVKLDCITVTAYCD